MQKIFMALILLFMFASAGLIAAPIFVDIDSYKQKLEESIKDSTGLDVKINGSGRVTFFPTPKISVNNVSIDNKVKGASNVSILKIDSVDVISSFYSIISGSVDIKSITLVHPVIEVERLPNGSTTWEELLKSLESSEIKQDVDFPDSIYVKNGTIAYNEKQKRVAIDYITTNIESDSAIGPFYMDGNFTSGEIVVKFDGEIGELEDGARSYFNLSSEATTLRMDGIYESKGKGGIFGDIEGKTTNLNSVVRLLFDNSSVFSSVKSKEELSLKGKFNISSKLASFRDILINSSSVQGNANIEALFSPNAGGPIQWDFSVLFNKVDIDALTLVPNQEKKTAKGVVDYYASSLGAQGISNYNFDISKNLSAQVDFIVKEMVYNGQKINNLQFDADIFSGKAAIHKFGADLPGNSTIELIGNIDHNGTRPLLLGQIKASGEEFRNVVNWIFPETSFIPEGKMTEFSFESKIKMTPHKINISDAYASFDESLITGSLMIRPKSTIPVITADVVLDRINFDSYGLSKAIQESVGDFSGGLANQNLATSWLKTLNMIYDINIDSRDIRYNGFDLKNAALSFVLSQGVAKVQKCVLSSNEISLNAVALVNLNADIPTIEVRSKSQAFNTSFLFSENNNSQNENGEWAWSTEEFDLRGIDRFNGNFKMSFDNLTHNKIITKNLIFDASLSKKVLSINSFKGLLYNGKFDINGSVGVEQLNPSIGISLALSNIDIRKLMANIYDDDYDAISGDLYLSGVIKTFGKNPDKWITELEMEGKVAAKNVNVKGFDLDNIILNSRQLYSVIDMDEVVQNSAAQGNTQFDYINGKMSASRGLMQLRDLNLNNKYSRGILAGNMSLKNFETKAITKISFWPESGKKVTLKVNFDGDIENLNRKIDTSELERYITDKGGR